MDEQRPFSGHLWRLVWPVGLALALLVLTFRGSQLLHATPDAQPISGTGTLEGREVAIASELGGPIVAVLVQEGDVVTAGQVLLRLDDSTARAQLAQAEATLSMAEANLARLRAGARPQALLAAEAALSVTLAQSESAYVAYLAAQDAISRPITLDLQLAQARTQMRMAEQQVAMAQADLHELEIRYQAALEENPAMDDTEREAWDLQLQAAQASIEQAQAELSAARANYRGYYALRNDPIQAQIGLIAAQSAYSASLAAVQQAQADLAALKRGSRPEELAIAQAQVAQARAAREMALTALDLLTLTAPISGQVGLCSYRAGEIAPQGLPLLTILDLDPIYLTLYVPANRIAEVSIGQAASIRVDAYPDQVFRGEVAFIATEAEFTPRSVQTADDRARLAFAVRLRIPNPDGRLRPGLPASATLDQAVRR